MKILATEGGLPRVSWGAVIAGVILSLTAYLILSVLGAAVGASLLAPLSDQYGSMRGFGFGSGVWVIVTTVISVSVGSYFAGRCAPVLGWLHGLLAWAVMTLFVIYGMASLIGGAVGTVGNMASTSATVAAATQPATNNGSMNGAAGTANGSIVDTVKQQVQGMMASATAVASSPQVQQDARQAADVAARNVARASWFSFAALLVGAIIAIASGASGFRHQPPFETREGLSAAELEEQRRAYGRAGTRMS